MFAKTRVYALWLVVSALISPSATATAHGESNQLPMAEGVGPKRVPVTLGVMSRCPDALLCESVFDEVFEKVGHQKVDLSLTFIGQLNTSEPVYGTTCKHGPLECAGNVHELCAAKYAGDSSAWWPFLHCLNHQGLELIGLEGIAVYCAQIAKIDWVDSGIETCVNGEEGSRLLRESVRQSQKLGIQKSCSVLISQKVRCVRDGSWQNCDGGHEPQDFVDLINAEYDRLNR